MICLVNIFAPGIFQLAIIAVVLLLLVAVPIGVVFLVLTLSRRSTATAGLQQELAAVRAENEKLRTELERWKQFVLLDRSSDKQSGTCLPPDVT